MSQPISVQDTYTATFVAKNANMWESKATVRKLTIVVQEP